MGKLSSNLKEVMNKISQNKKLNKQDEQILIENYGNDWEFKLGLDFDNYIDKSQNNKIESESESKTKNSLNLFDDDDNISFEEIFKPIENIETKKNEINKQNRINFH